MHQKGTQDLGAAAPPAAACLRFTNTEERLAGLHDKVPFLLEDAMKAQGADFHSALLPVLSHVERDGNLIMGQNPKSSHAIGKAMVEALDLVHAR